MPVYYKLYYYISYSDNINNYIHYVNRKDSGMNHETRSLSNNRTKFCFLLYIYILNKYNYFMR